MIAISYIAVDYLAYVIIHTTNGNYLHICRSMVIIQSVTSVTTCNLSPTLSNVNSNNSILMNTLDYMSRCSYHGSYTA